MWYEVQQAQQQSQTMAQLLAPYFPLLTPAALVGLAWKLRGVVDLFMNNHLKHFQETGDQIKSSVTQQTEILKAAIENQTQEMKEEFREQRQLFTTLAVTKRSDK